MPTETLDPTLQEFLHIAGIPDHALLNVAFQPKGMCVGPGREKAIRELKQGQETRRRHERARFLED